jgi:hypothetical protein
MRRAMIFISLAVTYLTSNALANEKSSFSPLETGCLSHIRAAYPDMVKITDLREVGKNPEDYMGIDTAISTGVTFVEHQEPWGVVFWRVGGDERNNKWYYFTCDPKSNSVSKIDERLEGKFHLWAIPPRYPVSVFGSLPKIEAGLSSEKWWIRLHAIVAYSQLLDFTLSSPGFGEDDWKEFSNLRAQAQISRNRILQSLQKMTKDIDPEVAKKALACVTLLENENNPDRLTYPDFAKSWPAHTDKGSKVIYSEEHSACYR